jgi:biotin carboxylase
MKGAVLLFGGTKEYIMSAISRLGYEPIVCDSFPNTDKFPRYINYPAVDAREGRYKAEVFASIPPESVKGNVLCHDSFVEVAAKLREHRFPDLGGITAQQAEYTCDKFKFKQLLVERGIETNRFTPFLPAESWDSICGKLGRPFIVKPRKESGARGIHIIDSMEAWDLWKSRYSQGVPVYLEQYLEKAREFCCDTIVQDGEILAQFTGEYTVGCLESNRKHEGFGVTFPGNVPVDRLAELRQIAKKFVREMKISSSFCHLEFYLHDGRWKFGEAALRMPGGLQLPAQSAIARIDLMEAFVLLSAGEKIGPFDAASFEDRFVGYHLFPRRTGTITKITASLDHPWIVETRILVKPGDTVQRDDTSVSRLAHVIYTADTLDELMERSRIVPSLLTIKFEDPTPR